MRATSVDRTRAAAVLGVAEVRLADEREFAARFPDREVGAMPPSRQPPTSPQLERTTHANLDVIKVTGEIGLAASGVRARRGLSDRGWSGGVSPSALC